jgi:predicted Zn-dependent peptidase
LFADHVYANQPIGTIASIEDLIRDDLVSYYAALFDTSRMLLVVVGDVEQATLEGLIGETFAGFDASGGRPDPPGAFSSEDTALDTEQATIPTNYILGLCSAPGPTDPDYPAMVLAVRHLKDRLFEEVRSVRNLSYAVSAGISSRLSNYTYLYVTATDPAATIPVMLDEVASLQQVLLEPSVLNDLMAVFVTSHYTGMDSNGAVASELGWWELFGGGRENADQYVAQLRAVTPADIQRVAGQYLQGFQFGVVGDPTSVSLELFQPHQVNE